MGWKRTLNYLHHRLARIPGTSYAIAAGFACGAAVSFTPFIGFHFLLAALFAWIIRGNVLTSAMGTIVGNPWTFPLIWFVTYQTGCWLLGWEASGQLGAEMEAMLHSFTFGEVLTSPLVVLKKLTPFFHSVLLPMLVGGLLIGAVVWGITYWPIYKLVSEYKRKRFEKRMKALERKLALGTAEETERDVRRTTADKAQENIGKEEGVLW
ncbi:DUF2062 domain-containing protein [Luteithermobacter gelatinilyticus]|uniref:DUF2062 domain-containing protein n=1 Tax=Luteithermobacter gelatinilyticus TaxID=2582913 RepID=UPI00143E0D5B|nr:DUF2062 domain-containing protein [Luteithermobacter gelatinilyticus]